MAKNTNHNLPDLDLSKLNVKPNDSTSMKFLMLVEGVFGQGVKKSIQKYNYTEQRYYQLLKKFKENGMDALVDQKRGPKQNSVRSDRVIHQIIRHRFLDPRANSEVIAQKLNQQGIKISKRSVERTIQEYGLQLVNEAAICQNRVRKKNALCNQGFALANGLSFLATDEAIHELLDIGQTDFKFNKSPHSFKLIVQRSGEIPKYYSYKAFLYSGDNNVVELLTQNYPKRWTIEEFFNFEGDMGWNRASTFNLNIRYGKQSLALIAQAATHQLKNKLPKPYKQWTANHIATQILTNMEGDLRVKDDTIIVTYYRDYLNLGIEQHYRNLPRILEKEGVNPRIPWLYDFKLDFRFK